MRFHRLDADAQIVGDLLVQATGNDAFEHLGFAARQFGQQGIAAGGLLVACKRLAGFVQHALDQAQQFFFLERFLDEVHLAFFHGRDRHGHVAMAGDEHDRQGGFALNQAVLQFQTGHSAHADVGDQAGDFARVVAADEGFGTVKATHPVILAFEQPLQGITHRFVVIDNINRAFFRYQTHSFTSVVCCVISGF